MLIMANSPNLIDSENYNFNKSIDSLEEPKPKLVQDTTTDVKFNMLANPLKIDILEKSDKEEDNYSVKSETVEFSSESSSSSSTRPNTPEPKEPKEHKEHYVPPPMRNQNEIRYRKIELLRIFQELEEKGIRLSTRYSIHSDLDEMEQEYEILRSIQNKKNGVNLYKSFLMNVVSGIEFVNETYNPFDFHLHGWSEHVSLGIDSYDDVFAEIYEKYKNSGQKVEPEIKLIFMLVASASSFHAANSMLKNTPGLSDVIKNNPQFVNNLSKKMMTEQKMRDPPEFIPNDNISGADPKQFMNKMYKSMPTPVNTRDKVIDSISEVTSTSKRRAKKKGLNVNI